MDLTMQQLAMMLQLAGQVECHLWGSNRMQGDILKTPSKCLTDPGAFIIANKHMHAGASDVMWHVAGVQALEESMLQIGALRHDMK
jgi:hypothetical protein